MIKSFIHLAETLNPLTRQTIGHDSSVSSAFVLKYPEVFSFMSYTDEPKHCLNMCETVY